MQAVKKRPDRVHDWERCNDRPSPRGRWLPIYDRVEEPDELDIPSFSRRRAEIISRNKVRHGENNPVIVKVLGTPESTMLWRRFQCNLSSFESKYSKRDEQISPLEIEFMDLSTKWYKETGMMSLMSRRAMHPAYQRIIGMGKDALPMIFKELHKTRGHWLWALVSITGEDVAKPGQNMRQAVDEWLNWGRLRGYV